MSETHNTQVRFVIFRDGQALGQHVADGGRVNIGRTQSSTIRLDDPTVNGMHAVIESTPGSQQLRVTDLGSASGTFVNGVRISTHVVRSGDRLMIGAFEIAVEFASEQPRPSATPMASAPRPLAPAPAVAVRASAAPPPSKFNPFQAKKPEMRKAATPFDTGNPDGAYYGIVPTTMPLSRDEVETTEMAVEVSVMWGDRNVLHVDHLVPPRDYSIGEADEKAPVDFVLGRAALGFDRLPLVASDGSRVTVIVPSGASGEVTDAKTVRSLERLGAEGGLRPSSSLTGGSEFELPRGATVRIRHREFQFVVKDVHAGRKVSGVARIDTRPIFFVAGAALLASLVLVAFYFSPPRPRGLSADLLNTDSRLIQYLLEANALEEEEPEWMNGADTPGGGDGKRHDGDEGQMGDEAAEKSTKKYGIKGPQDNPDPVMAREEAKEEAANVGVLGVLPGLVGSVNAPTSPYGADQALGRDAMNALGAMTGTEIGANFGYGGLGLRGTGRGGGGTGQGTIGMGNFGTIGRGGGRGAGEGGYGSGAGGFKGRGSGVPQVRTGDVTTMGSLSKEVIRRVVRRHLNEVKFCYEQQLNARPDLAGRVMTKFVISPTGSVQTAAISDSALRNDAVESCITRAIRRWTFPAPEGGGVVVVDYPFMLDAAGG